MLQVLQYFLSYRITTVAGNDLATHGRYVIPNMINVELLVTSIAVSMAESFKQITLAACAIVRLP